ncbi:hypothetical protein [Chryseolinea serpens]|uniref:hypothetical protein n=1 Tax=Chryseolinea serpens TaxID=947013 RepID=UPI00116143DE|nr:hypothetical protein [Chryseolinea serpens]
MSIVESINLQVSFDEYCIVDSAQIFGGDIAMVSSTARYLYFYESTIRHLDFVTLPRTLTFSNTEFTSEVLLSRWTTLPSNEVCILRIRSVEDLTKLRIDDYRKFCLDFDWYDFEYDEKVDIYTRLLKNFKSRNQTLNYEKLDKEFQAFKLKELGIFGHVLNGVTRFWWDYGYKKHQVLLRAFQLNIFFFLVNLFFYPILLSRGYQLQKFVEIDFELQKKFGHKKLLLFLARIPYVFLYTGYIFWGWKLDLHSIQIRNVLLFGFVLLQYLTGIVCLGYIFNLVVTK